MSSRFIMPFADVGSGIKPSSGAKLFFFETDGVTPKNTFSDQLSTPTANTNPVISDSNGVFGDIYIEGAYKVDLQNKNGSQIFGGAIVLSTGASGESIGAFTLAETVANTAAIDGQIVQITDRGDGQFVYLTGQTPNTFNIVAADKATLDLVLLVPGVANALWFGAKNDNTFNSAPAINSALEQFKSVYLPAGFYKIEESLVIGIKNNFYGDGKSNIVTVPSDTGATGTNLELAADVVGISIESESSHIHDFRIISLEANATQEGIRVGKFLGVSDYNDPGNTTAEDAAQLEFGGDRATIERIHIENCFDGITVRLGNLGTIRDITSIGNQADGIRFTSETFETNVWTIEGYIDTRVNGRDGFHIEGVGTGTGYTNNRVSRSSSFDIVTCQNNDRFGFFNGGRFHNIITYCERNGADTDQEQVVLASTSIGNKVTTLEDSAVDFGEGNTIFATHFNSTPNTAGAEFASGNQGLTRFDGNINTGIRIDDNDGTNGFMDLKKNGANEFNFVVGGTAGNQDLKILNSNAGSLIHVIAEGRYHAQLSSIGASASSNADGIIIENNANTGLSILTPNTDEGLIFFGDTESSSVGRIGYDHATNNMSFTTGSITKAVIESAGNFRPGLDDAYDLGTATFRWDDVFATNATIQTSDKHEKQDETDFSEALKSVAVGAKQLMKAFKWKSAVTKKGDDARFHFGLIYQDLHALFIDAGLNPSDYGIFIEQTWYEKEIIVPLVPAVISQHNKTETIENTVPVLNMVVTLDNGRYIQREEITSQVQIKEINVYDKHDLYDEDGEKVGVHSIPVMEDYESEPEIPASSYIDIKDEATEGYDKKVRRGLRYSELYALILSV